MKAISSNFSSSKKRERKKKKQISVDEWKVQCGRIVSLLVALMATTMSMSVLSNCDFFRTTYDLQLPPHMTTINATKIAIEQEPQRIYLSVGLFRYASSSSGECREYPKTNESLEDARMHVAQTLAIVVPLLSIIGVLAGIWDLFIRENQRCSVWVMVVVWFLAPLLQIFSFVALHNKGFCQGEVGFGECRVGSGARVAVAAACFHILALFGTLITLRNQIQMHLKRQRPDRLYYRKPSLEVGTASGADGKVGVSYEDVAADLDDEEMDVTMDDVSHDEYSGMHMEEGSTASVSASLVDDMGSPVESGPVVDDAPGAPFMPASLDDMECPMESGSIVDIPGTPFPFDDLSIIDSADADSMLPGDDQEKHGDNEETADDDLGLKEMLKAMSNMFGISLAAQETKGTTQEGDIFPEMTLDGIDDLLLIEEGGPQVENEAFYEAMEYDENEPLQIMQLGAAIGDPGGASSALIAAEGTLSQGEAPLKKELNDATSSVGNHNDRSHDESLERGNVSAEEYTDETADEPSNISMEVEPTIFYLKQAEEEPGMVLKEEIKEDSALPPRIVDADQNVRDAKIVEIRQQDSVLYVQGVEEFDGTVEPLNLEAPNLSSSNPMVGANNDNSTSAVATIEDAEETATSDVNHGGDDHPPQEHHVLEPNKNDMLPAQQQVTEQPSKEEMSDNDFPGIGGKVDDPTRSLNLGYTDDETAEAIVTEKFIEDQVDAGVDDKILPQNSGTLIDRDEFYETVEYDPDHALLPSKSDLETGLIMDKVHEDHATDDNYLERTLSTSSSARTVTVLGEVMTLGYDASIYHPNGGRYYEESNEEHEDDDEVPSIESQIHPLE